MTAPSPRRRPAGPGRTSGPGRRPYDDEPPLAWDPPVPIHVYWAAQDDPKKNTAKRLQRHHLIRLTQRPRDLPGGAILLDPMARRSVSREDAPRAEEKGLAAIDCSWEQAEGTFLGLRRHLEPRALPYLVAGNPTKYGQPFVLSTAEAIAAALVIMGHEDAARRLMGVFPWAKTFWAVNAEPLAAYAACETSSEVVATQKEFLPEPLLDEDAEGSDEAPGPDDDEASGSESVGATVREGDEEE